MKNALLINGGAAVALLAFLGNCWKQVGVPASLTQHVANALLLFVGGVFLAAAGSGLKYLALKIAHDSPRCSFKYCNWASIIFVLLSYLAFAGGGGFAYWAFGAS